MFPSLAARRTTNLLEKSRPPVSNPIGGGIPGIIFAINKHWGRARAHNRRGAGDDRKTRQDDLVSSTYVKSSDRNIQRDRTIAYRDAVPAAHSRREALFELADEWAFGRNPTRLYTFGKITLLVPVEQRLIHWNHLRQTLHFGSLT